MWLNVVKCIFELDDIIYNWDINVWAFVCVCVCGFRGQPMQRGWSVEYSQLTLRYVSFLMRFTGLQMFLVMKMCVRDLGG